MIAEATTSREHRQPQQRRRSAARQQTHAALRDALAQRDGPPTEGPPLGCAERQRSAAQQQTIEAFWKRVEERQREAMDALSGASSVPVPVPVPEPPAAADSPRRFVVPNVIAGEAPVVRKPGPTFADVLRTLTRTIDGTVGAELTRAAGQGAARDVGLLHKSAGHASNGPVVIAIRWSSCRTAATIDTAVPAAVPSEDAGPRTPARRSCRSSTLI